MFSQVAFKTDGLRICIAIHTSYKDDRGVNGWIPDGPNVKDPFNHLLHQSLLEQANKGRHSRHVYCYLSEGVFVHVLFFVVKVLVDITPAKTVLMLLLF